MNELNCDVHTTAPFLKRQSNWGSFPFSFFFFNILLTSVNWTFLDEERGGGAEEGVEDFWGEMTLWNLRIANSFATALACQKQQVSDATSAKNLVPKIGMRLVPSFSE